jgi:spermidine dehydrogenase
MEKGNEQLDEALGLNASILRRDFLNGILLSLGRLWAAHLSPVEFSAQGKKTRSSPFHAHWGGNTEDVFTAGHAVRDGAYDNPHLEAADTGEVVELLIVGGGFSGLAAAYFFEQAKKRHGPVLVLENHRVLGGNARRDEFTIKGQTLYAPQGSIVAQDLPPALAPSPAVERLFEDLKIDFNAIRIAKEVSAFSVLWDQKSYGVQPRWYSNLLEAPLPDPVKKDFLAFIGTIMPFYTKTDWKAELRRLDQFTFKDYVEREQKWSAEFFTLMQPDLAAFFGFPDVVSAAAVYAQYGGGPRALYSFPGGNSGFYRHLLKALLPEAIAGGKNTDDIINGRINVAALDRKGSPLRIRSGATVVRVEHEGKPDEAKLVRITFLHGGKLYRLRARRVVMAGGGYITQHVVRDLPAETREAYSRFRYAPVLWINVALDNSRALDKAGLNYISTYHDGLGVMLVRYEQISGAAVKARRNPDRPNVIGIGAPRFSLGLSPQEQAVRGRTEMLRTSFRDYERQVREELVRLLGPWGFDPKKDIQGISISRWGHHGYIFPYAGFYSDGAVEVVKKPHGRIAFAHTELDRFSHMVGAMGQGHRAVQDLLERIYG